MASVILRYDDSRPAEDMEEIHTEFLINHLPDVCIRCGKPAVEVTDLTFFNYEGGRMVSIKAPVCDGHPLLGLMFPLLVLCIVFVFLLFPVFVFVEWVFQISWLSAVLFYLMLIILSIGIAIHIIFKIFDLHTEKVEANGVEIGGVSQKFVDAYRKFRKARENQASAAIYAVPGVPPVPAGGSLGVPPGSREPRPRSKGKKRKAVTNRTIQDLLRRPAFFISLGVILFLGISCIGIGILLRNPNPSLTGSDNPPNNVDLGKNPLFPEKAPTKPFPLATPDFALAPISPKNLDGVIAYWPLDEGKGDRIADHSPSQMEGTLIRTEWVKGIQGSALWFDGQGSFVNLGTSPKLNFGAGQPFTFCGWVGTKADQGTMISLRHSKNGAADMDIQVSGGKITAVVRADGSEFGPAQLSGQTINDGTWHHFALTRQPDGHIELFVDGKSQGKVRGPNSQGSITTNLRALGAELYWVQTKWGLEHPLLTGALDEICIFNRVLSVDEIGSLAGRKK